MNSKKRTGLFAGLATALLLCVGVVGAGLIVNNALIKAASPIGGSEPGLNIEIPETPGIEIKKAYSGYDGQGNPYQDFSYTTTPAYIKDEVVTITISFADSRANPETYLTSSSNSTAKTFRITCLQAFDSVATVRVAIGQATADLTMHFVQKIINAEYSGATTIVYPAYTSNLFDPGTDDEDNHPNFVQWMNTINPLPFSVNLSTVYTKPLISPTAPKTLVSIEPEEGSNLTNFADVLKPNYNDPTLVNILLEPALTNVSLNQLSSDTGNTGFYKAFDDVFDVMTSANKQLVANSLTEANRISFCLEMSQVLFHLEWDGMLFDGLCDDMLFVELPVMPSWDIGVTATSISTNKTTYDF